jgi:hypothetical protein
VAKKENRIPLTALFPTHKVWSASNVHLATIKGLCD